MVGHLMPPYEGQTEAGGPKVQGHSWLYGEFIWADVESIKGSLIQAKDGGTLV